MRRGIVVAAGLILTLAVGIVVLLKENSQPAHVTSAPETGITELVTSSSRSESLPPVPTTANMRKLAILDEVLREKNDNDPRLDEELKNFNAAEKQLLRTKYRSTPREQLNHRGTLVFLLGRELSSAEDIQFLKSVLSEPPCLSLENCARAPSASQDDHHHDSTNDITRAYPQIVALKQIEAYLSDPANAKSPLRNEALSTLDQAKASPNKRISMQAEELLIRFRQQP